MAKNNVVQVEPLLEDSVECLFFSSSSVADDLYWKNLCQQLNLTIQTLSESYLWHKDDFKVHLPIAQENKDDKPPHLASVTCFGDNIEDEWFIVYLTVELSKHYKDLIIQIKDNDGEFLLIEAANYLPAWASPDSTDNRVYIHQNQIHIIPPNLQDTDSKLDFSKAIKIIAQASDKTKASTEIQQSILQRVGQYPEKIHESFHRSVAKLPVDIATLLTLKPALIAPIVSAYCNYDILDAKACKNVALEDSVFVNVKFTKCLFAMLMHARPIRNVKFKEVNDKRSVISQKLTYGYQILMNQPTLDIFSTKQFKNFMSKLNATGYFKNNIKGSADYNELLKNAKEFYSVMECPINSQVSNEISQLIVSSDFAQIKKTLLEKCSSPDDLQEDNEDWLNINSDHLNDLLNSRYGQKAKFANDSMLTAHNVTSELSSFLIQTSDFEGIETNKREESKEGIEFDPDDFANSVQKMLDMITLGATDEEDASYSDDDYFESGGSGDEIVDEELKVIKQDKLQDSNTILLNIVQSMKEEGLSGPSSNLMKTIGFNKTDFLDSDDDE